MKLRIAIAALLSTLVIPSQAQLIFHESFSYSDGYIVTVSTNLWTRHSGSLNDANVKNGKLQNLNAVNTDDVNRALTNSGTGPGPAGPVVYAAFTVNSTNLPVGAGNFFAHFKDNGTANFRDRLFGIRGAAPNSWRLSLSAAAGTTTVFPLDLATNVDYRLVLSYDTNAFLGQLWIDPVVETDQKIQTSDSTVALAITTFAFRQSNSGGQAGQLLIDDLDTGLTFADMGLGTPKPPTIYYQPRPAIIVNDAANTNISVVAGGAGTVTFQWEKDGVTTVDDGVNITGSTSNIISILNASTANAGDYQVIVTSTTNGVFAGSVTSSVAHVTVNIVPRPPVFSTQPQSATLTVGSLASFNGLADGSAPLTYQWFVVTNSTTNVMSGEMSTAISFTVTDSSLAGQYFLQASNPFGVTNSQFATLTVIPPIATNIAYLRTKVTTNGVPTDTNLVYETEGIVTSRTNTTGIANIQFYMQDATAGIVVFVGGGDGTNSNPRSGDKVHVKGQLGSFNNLFEFNLSATNTYHSVQVLSIGNPMPLSRSFSDFSVATNLALMETNIEALLVTVTNVFLSGAGGNFTGNQTLTMTNSAGQTFPLFINATALSQTNPPVVIPAFAYEITAVMGHFLSTYEIVPTRFVDIVTNLPEPFSLTVGRTGNAATVKWSAADGSTFSIYSADDVRGPFTRIFGLNFLDTSGSYTETNSANARFYRATSP